MRRMARRRVVVRGEGSTEMRWDMFDASLEKGLELY
jgi:hypothetical protein